MFKPVRKAVIPAAGLGTRFLPATKATPKEMLPIVDKPTIQYIIEEALASGIEDILIITGRSKRAIEDHFDRSIELELNLEASGKTKELELVRKISDIRIHYIRQKEPRGLGHAILCAKHFVGDEPFAVLLGDDVVDSRVPALKQLIDVYDKTGASVLGVQEVPQEKVSAYGIVAGEPTDEERTVKVNDMVEKPSGEYIEYPDLIINLSNYSVIYMGKPVDMPPKELELLYFLATSPNQVFTREQLLDHIWGYEYVGDTRTVDVHIKRLREKIHDHEKWSIGTVWGVGYKFESRK